LEPNLIPVIDRQKRIGHAAVLVWLNGGAHLAYAVESELFKRGYLTHVIAAQTDGSVMLELARNMTTAGLVTICAADFLYEVERERAEALMDPSQFVDLDASRFDSPEDAARAVTEKLTGRGITPADR
jgi:adenylylsulfate kinase-like enzyme